MTWKNETRFENIEELFKNLLNLGGNGGPVACRGQADINWPLRTSLDRILDTKADYAARLSEESTIIEKFRILSREHFRNGIEENYLSGPDKISALSILQSADAVAPLNPVINLLYPPTPSAYVDLSNLSIC